MALMGAGKRMSLAKMGNFVGLWLVVSVVVLLICIAIILEM